MPAAWKDLLYRLLRWSERYTRTDMVYLAHGGFWIMAGQAVYMVTAFALTIAFANLLPKEAYGTYRFVLSIAAIIATLGLTGIDAAIPQAVARGYEGMLRKGFATYLRFGFGMALGGAAIGGYYLLHGNGALAYSFLLVGFASPVFAGASLYGEFLTGRRDFRAMALASMAQSALTALALLATMALTENVPALVTAYFASNTLGAVALYRFVVMRYHPNDKIDPESTRFGYHVSFTNVLGVLADQLDKILVFHLLGAAELALYSIAILVPEYARSACKLFGNLAMPKYATRSREELSRSAVAKTVQLAFLLALAAIAYALLAPEIFKFIYPRYLDALPYTMAFSLLIIAGASNIPGAMLNAQRSVKGQYALALTDNTAKIILLMTLAYAYGLWGIVAARIIGRYVTLILGTALASRLARRP